MKNCNRCRQDKPLTEYYADKTGKDGLASICKECLRAARRARWTNDYGGQKLKDAERRDSYKLFVYRLRREFNMTEEQYDQMLKEQDGRCALCKKPETREHHRTGSPQRLSVDHDHSCCPKTPACGSCNRGLLCYECNLLLGKIERTPGLETAIVEYLSKTR